jgi:hypothetical protein
MGMGTNGLFSRRAIVALCGLALSAFAAPASAAFYVAGDFSAPNPNWSANGIVMTDNGNGTHSATISSLTDGARIEFKITDGTWSNSWPGANSWMVVSGTDITVTYTPTPGDSTTPTSNRIGLSDEQGTWTVVGGFQGWNNSNAATAMTSQGGGIYTYQHTFTTTDPQDWKVVKTGSWDAIGGDGRTINASNASYTPSAPNETVVFTVNALAGTITAAPVPEPASIGLLALGAVTAFRRRRTV